MNVGALKTCPLTLSDPNWIRSIDMTGAAGNRCCRTKCTEQRGSRPRSKNNTSWDDNSPEKQCEPSPAEGFHKYALMRVFRAIRSAFALYFNLVQELYSVEGLEGIYVYTYSFRIYLQHIWAICVTYAPTIVFHKCTNVHKIWFCVKRSYGHIFYDRKTLFA